MSEEQQDPIGGRVARLLGYYGVLVQGGSLAPDRYTIDEIEGIAAAAAALRVSLANETRRRKAAEDERDQHEAEWSADLATLRAERDELAKRVKDLETPDHLMPPHGECAYPANDLSLIADDMELPIGECREVYAFKTLPDRWLACVVVTRDDHGDPDDTELRLFATRADADAVLARPTLRQEGV